MKKLLIFLVVILVIAGAVKGGLTLVKRKRAAEAKLPKPVVYDMRVKTMHPKISHVLLTLPYLALTKSNDDVKISSRMSGRVLYIVDNGKMVKKGEVIARLDDKELKTKLESLNFSIASLKSQIKSKEIALKNLLKTHQRTKELLKVKGASKEQFEKEQTGIEAIKAGINTLKLKIKEVEANKDAIKNSLSYAIIKAPVSGIAQRLSNIGDIAMPGKPLVSISAKTNGYLLVRLPANVESNEIIYKKKKYSLEPLGTTFNGLLEYVANIDENLASNQTVSIDVVIYDKNGYMLPHDALLDRDGKSSIVVVKGARANAKEVKVVANGEQGVVVEGINPKESIVVAKQDILLKLLGGIKVRAVK